MGKESIKKNEVIFEIRRQIFHMIVGLSLGLFLLMYGKTASIVFFSVMILLGLYIKHKVEKKNYVKIISGLLDIFEREKDSSNPGKGAMYLLIGSALAVILFELVPAFYGILVISLSDAFSTIVGKAFGRKRSWNKSILGSFTFFITTYAILLVPYGLYYSFFVAVLASFAEALPKLNDNIIIPVFVGFLLQIV
ncbi:MAG: hypothetical protein PHW96_00280 [Candidatus Nanoarchaeia archaeon]|nr:hypothetical protein [Candidatus Nanoarchaeia archaeon]